MRVTLFAPAVALFREMGQFHMEPELVGDLLHEVETRWVDLAAHGPGEAKKEMTDSCVKVVSSIVQGSDGEKDRVEEYMDVVCAQKALQSWEHDMCAQFADGIQNFMSGDPEFNRDMLNVEKFCTKFYTVVENEAEVVAKKRKLEEEAMRKAKTDAAKAKIEEAKKKAEMAKEKAARIAAKEAELKGQEEQQLKAVAEAKQKLEKTAEEKQKHQLRGGTARSQAGEKAEASLKKARAAIAKAETVKASAKKAVEGEKTEGRKEVKKVEEKKAVKKEEKKEVKKEEKKEVKKVEEKKEVKKEEKKEVKKEEVKKVEEKNEVEKEEAKLVEPHKVEKKAK